jgi:hypothetical protein
VMRGRKRVRARKKAPTQADALLSPDTDRSRPAER